MHVMGEVWVVGRGRVEEADGARQLGEFELGDSRRVVRSVWRVRCAPQGASAALETRFCGRLLA